MKMIFNGIEIPHNSIPICKPGRVISIGVTHMFVDVKTFRDRNLDYAPNIKIGDPLIVLGYQSWYHKSKAYVVCVSPVGIISIETKRVEIDECMSDD